MSRINHHKSKNVVATQFIIISRGEDGNYFNVRDMKQTAASSSQPD